MKIIRLDAERVSNGVIVEALLKKGEFKSLAGDIENLVLFSSDTISEKTKAIKTGARHNHARYLLLPVCIRRAFKADTHDFENIRCSCVENDGRLYVIFLLEKLGVIQK